MQISKFKDILNHFSSLRPANYTLDVKRRERCIISSSDSIFDITEFITKYTLIKDGRYILTIYDSARLSDVCKGLLQRLSNPMYEEYRDISQFGYLINCSKKGLDIYLYDDITKNVNLVDKMEIWSTKSRVFRWILKLIKKL